jgi:hypothetical protein
LLSQEGTVFFAAMNFGIVGVRSFLTQILDRKSQVNRRRARSALRQSLLRHTSFTHLACLSCLAFFLAGLISRAQTQEFQFHSAGVRMGFPAENTSNNFLQTEVFLDYNLWRWNLSTNWDLQSRLDISAGWLGQRGDAAFIGTLGPSLELRRAGFPLSLEGGSSPTYISRYHFSSTDLGENVQFTSHIGLFCDVTSRWRVGYRFQHMSNAGIRKPNPGFNLHMLSISYLF